MSVDGAGYTNTIVNGGGVARCFNISNSVNATIMGLTISNGVTTTGGAA